jgi:DNA polymerase III sliding clamp (beta) subunit (PCNA family)
MLEELKFVQGAVAKKDFLPALTHFVIENGTVRGYDGALALCSPIALDIACKPKADALVRAIASCKDTVSLSMTAGGRLSVRSGKFRAMVDCHPEESTPHALPEGEHIALDGQLLLDGLKRVAPFIGDDASRPWTNGALLNGASVFATNNVTLVEAWTGLDFPHVVNVPRKCVREILRVNEAPTAVQLGSTSITFHYANQRWIRSQLLDTKWPDLARVLDTEAEMVPIWTELFDGVRTIKPFADKLNRVLFTADGITTSRDEGAGASFEVPGVNCDGIYNIDMLLILEGIATHIDFSKYPKPALFRGDRLRGAIVGQKGA